ncbi:MAG: hypothetical protein VYE18_03150 [Pseudomonadota bacterium]|nr:hypothetical protein [Pseudomonadota bacterium]
MLTSYRILITQLDNLENTHLPGMKLLVAGPAMMPDFFSKIRYGR